MKTVRTNLPERFISVTSDGSSTFRLKDHNESYHSAGGAYEEAMHIYIRSGLDYYRENIRENNRKNLYPDRIRPNTVVVKESNPAAAGHEDFLSRHGGRNRTGILDIGLGTALNCILTASYAFRLNLPVYYHGIEKYPLTPHEVRQLNFPEYIAARQLSVGIPVERMKDWFEKIHAAPWEQDTELFPGFILHKSHCALEDFSDNKQYNVVYFDAFSPNTQPGLWTEQVFRNMYAHVKYGGVLVTYCSKGIVKAALRNAGFTVKRLPGINGKRHIVRALKSYGPNAESEDPGRESVFETRSRI